MGSSSQIDERYFEISLCLAAERQHLEKSAKNQTASPESQPSVVEPTHPKSAPRPRSTSYFLQQFESTMNDRGCETIPDDAPVERSFSLSDVLGEGQLTEEEEAATQEHLLKHLTPHVFEDNEDLPVGGVGPEEPTVQPDCFIPAAASVPAQPQSDPDQAETP